MVAIKRNLHYDIGEYPLRILLAISYLTESGWAASYDRGS